MSQTSLSQLQAALYQRFDRDAEPITNFMIWLAEAYHLPRQLSVLDVGCGTGRMIEAYAKHGWHVTGMEPDPDFFKYIQPLAKRYNTVRLLEGGFDEIHQQNAFGLITAINDPFAYLLEIPQRIDALKRMYAALRPGGVMFIEIKNFLYKLLYHEPFSEELAQVGDQHVAHMMQHEVDFHHARWIHRDEYIVEGDPQVIRKLHEVAIIPLPELLYFIEQVGFIGICTFNTYESRVTEKINGPLMLIAARKPS